MNVSVIIPAYNEAAVLGHTLSRVRRLNPHEIIVIDGGSDDATRASVQRMRDSWAQLQAPPVDVPAALRRRMSRRRAEILPWRRHAAAAALLFTVGMALRFGAGWLPAPAHVVPPIDAGSTTPMTPSDPMRPHLVAAHADHLELRSGPVRLLLVTSTEPPPLDTNPSLGSDLR